MATIPLPALSVHAPQPDVAGSLGQAISLQDLMQRRKLIPGQLQAQQQQLQAGEMENQQKAQQLKDSQVMATVLSKWDPQSDTSGQKLAKSFVDAGGSGQGAMAIQQKMLDRQKALSDIAKNDAETGAKQLETKKGQNDLLAGKIGAIAALPDEQLAQGISELSQNLDPQHAQVAAQLAQSNDPQKMRQGLTLLQKGYMGETAQIEEALKTAQTRDANANATVKEGEAKFGGGQQIADSRYRFLQAQAAKGIQPSADDAAFLKAYEKQKLLVPVASANIRMEGMGKIRQFPVYDSQTKQTVYMDSNEINDAKLREPGRFTVPSYTPEAEIQKQTGKTFGPGGKGSEELLAFGTALAHADLLKQAALAMKNGDTQALNGMKSAWNTQFGSPLPTNAQEIANVYTREVTKAISAGHITDNEVKTQGATVDASKMSPTQMIGAMDTYKSLMQSKADLRTKQLRAGQKGQVFGTSDSGGTIRARDTGGKLHEAPAGTALPQGWTLEK